MTSANWQCKKCGTRGHIEESEFPVVCCGIEYSTPSTVDFSRNTKQSQAKLWTDCIHRSEQFRFELCTTCCGKTEIKVFGCQVHGECTIGRQLPGIVCCSGCCNYSKQPSSNTLSILEEIIGSATPREIGWERDVDVIEAHQLLFNETVDSIRLKECPPGFSNSGIVVLGGSSKYFLCAYILVSLLRRLGCKLPVEWWYLGPHEMDVKMMRMAESLGDVECVNLVHRLDANCRYPRMMGGWQAKVWSIMYSKFEDVMFLDADIVPLEDPSFLLDSKEYRDDGAIFWPDYPPMGWSISDAGFRTAGLPVPGNTNKPTWRYPTDYFPFESGQVVVNKKKHWNALELAAHINDHSDFWYPETARGRHEWHIYGDKDTFYLAWHRLKSSFAMPRACGFSGDSNAGAFLQHDFQGNVLFHHRVQPPNKWSLHGENKKFPADIQFENCLDILEELRSRWVGHPYDYDDENKQEREISKKNAGFKLWFRKDFGQTQLQMLPGGGCENSSYHWTIRIIEDKPMMVLSDYNKALAFMGQDDFGNWVNHKTKDFLIDAPPIGFDLPSQPDEAFLWHEIVNCNEYQLPDRFSAGDVIIDVGAHCGIFTMACLQRGAGRVISVEPHPDNLNRLSKNIKDKYDGRSLIVPAAAWRCGQRPGHVFIAQPEGAKHSGGWSAIGTKTGIAVPTVPFDTIVKLAGPVKLVKLDCEGSEWCILDTFKDWALVEAWCGEYHHSTLEDAESRLNTIFAVGNYKVKVIPNPKTHSLGHFWAWR